MKVVLPCEPDFYENYAAEELKLRVKECTGQELS